MCLFCYLCTSRWPSRLSTSVKIIFTVGWQINYSHSSHPPYYCTSKYLRSASRAFFSFRRGHNKLRSSSLRTPLRWGRSGGAPRPLPDNWPSMEAEQAQHLRRDLVNGRLPTSITSSSTFSSFSRCSPLAARSSPFPRPPSAFSPARTDLRLAKWPGAMETLLPFSDSPASAGCPSS